MSPRIKRIRRPGRIKPPEMPRAMFETRTHRWEEVGLAKQISGKALRRAWVETVLTIPLLVGVLLLYAYRREVFGTDLPVRIATVAALLALSWNFARNVGRVLGPSLFKRMDPATAGTVGFVIRLATMLAALVVALRIAGLQPRDLAVGGAFTAVILGLAAQQTIGNLFAGTVLLSARPFRVGDRVRLQGGPLAGELEGTVSSLGLLYTVLSDGDEDIMVPNSAVLSVAIMPLRDPDAVDLRARLRAGVTPEDLQDTLEHRIDVPLLERPRIVLEELDGAEVVVRVQATPRASIDGPRLASEVLEAVQRHGAAAERNGTDEPHPPGTPSAGAAAT